MDTTAHLAIADRIKALLVTSLERDPALVANVRASDSLFEGDVRLDSVEAVGLAAAIEEEFAIQIDAADFTVALFESLDTLASYVALSTAGRDGGSPPR